MDVAPSYFECDVDFLLGLTIYFLGGFIFTYFGGFRFYSFFVCFRSGSV